MTARSAIALGRYGEDVAARYLVAAGYTVLDRNWRCRDGEIDIVARGPSVTGPPGPPGPTGTVLVVCEVKTRTGAGYQHPMAAVGAAKAERLRHLAHRWLADRWPGVGRGQPPPDEVRIDLVSVLRPADGRGAAAVEHARGVV